MFTINKKIVIDFGSDVPCGEISGALAANDGLRRQMQETSKVLSEYTRQIDWSMYSETLSNSMQQIADVFRDQLQNENVYESLSLALTEFAKALPSNEVSSVVEDVVLPKVKRKESLSRSDVIAIFALLVQILFWMWDQREDAQMRQMIEQQEIQIQQLQEENEYLSEVVRLLTILVDQTEHAAD